MGDGSYKERFELNFPPQRTDGAMEWVTQSDESGQVSIKRRQRR